MKLFEDQRFFTKEQVIDLLAAQNMVIYNNEMPIDITFDESREQVLDNFDYLITVVEQNEENNLVK
jgi:hypothetical protein